MSRTQKRVLIILSSFLVLAFAAVLAFGFYLYNSVKGTAHKIYEPVARPKYVSKESKTAQADLAVSNELPFTVLVMGVDQRPGDAGRSDTLLLLGVNPLKNDVLMLSIPRDTRTTIAGLDKEDKINHAYAFGGVDMAMRTVEDLLDYPVDYYVKADMEGFVKIIDLLGGVEVDNPFAFTYGEHLFPKGQQKLNGDQALLYSRMRYDDPRGDFGRSTRQRQILREIMKNTLTVNSLTKVNSMLEEVGDNVKTNLSFNDMKEILISYKPKIEGINQNEIAGQGKTIDGIWYYLVSEEEKSRIHELLKNHQQTKTESP